MTDLELINEAIIIKDETQQGSNTATRVGEMIEHIIENKINNDKIVTQIAGENDANVPSEKAVKTYVDESSVVINKKITLTSADILALFTNPKTLIEAGGVNTIVRLISAIGVFKYNSIQYASNNTFFIGLGQTFGDMTNFNNLLGQNQDAYQQSIIGATLSSSGFNSQIINAPIKAYCKGNDPINGDSTIDLYITYTVITL